MTYAGTDYTYHWWCACCEALIDKREVFALTGRRLGENVLID